MLKNLKILDYLFVQADMKIIVFPIENNEK